MNINTQEERKAWMPYVHAVLSLCSIGQEVGYFMMNPKMQYEMWNRMRSFLKQHELHDKEQLIADIEWYLETGRRDEFFRDSCLLSMLSAAERSRYIQLLTNEQRRRQLTVVSRYLWSLPPGGIAAYDFSWIMLKCFAGKQVGYLSEDEMWSYIGRIIPMIKENFSEWETYIASYAVGQSYLLQESPSSFVSKNRQYIMQMMSFRQSPMLQFKP
ncbi:DUF1266 domain-containing protein [Paenibacillus bouchesdurhonensis]|uniref:DUF1266 domain-containing protein n=1 Tax=Paenibacillus bouchesdurhonensis TaxID=1870990 RepID=UPI0019008A8B|nr:DUF1266 domain-containing protein [Paenibacillus bouchesdurhonensis]